MKYIPLYEKRFEFVIIFLIMILTMIISIISENLIVYEVVGLDYDSIKIFIMMTGILCAVLMELWIRKGNFWCSVRKRIIEKGISYSGTVIDCKIITHQKGRGADWTEYIPVIQLEDGTVIKGNSCLTEFPASGNQCIVTLYRKHYIIMEVVSAG